MAQFRTGWDDPTVRGDWWVELEHQRDRRYRADEVRLYPPILEGLLEHLAEDMVVWRRLTDESAGLEYRRPQHGNTIFVNEFPPGICLKADAAFPGVFVVRDFMLDEVLEALHLAASEGPKLLASARRILDAEGIEVGDDYDPAAELARLEKLSDD